MSNRQLWGASVQPQFSRTTTLFDDLVKWTQGELDRRGECHIECPNCHKPGSSKNPHFSFGEKGGHCFVCGQSYKLSKLAELFGLNTSKKEDGRPTITPREIVPN